MTKPTKRIIAICSSAAFYRTVNEIAEELESLGCTALVPSTATAMKQNNDYDVSHYKTWFADPGDYDKKAELMRGHFDKIDEADAILVVNEEKHGVKNYIGGNVLMEMALAFHGKKPIFLLHGVPEDSPFEEEILGMQPILLKGQAKNVVMLWPEDATR